MTSLNNFSEGIALGKEKLGALLQKVESSQESNRWFEAHTSESTERTLVHWFSNVAALQNLLRIFKNCWGRNPIARDSDLIGLGPDLDHQDFRMLPRWFYCIKEWKSCSRVTLALTNGVLRACTFYLLAVPSFSFLVIKWYPEELLSQVNLLLEIFKITFYSI